MVRGRGGLVDRAHRGDDGALIVRGRAERARHPNADRHQPSPDGVRQRAGPRSLQRRRLAQLVPHLGQDLAELLALSRLGAFYDDRCGGCREQLVA